MSLKKRLEKIEKQAGKRRGALEALSDEDLEAEVLRLFAKHPELEALSDEELEALLKERGLL